MLRRLSVSKLEGTSMKDPSEMISRFGCNVMLSVWSTHGFQVMGIPELGELYLIWKETVSIMSSCDGGVSVVISSSTSLKLFGSKSVSELHIVAPRATNVTYTGKHTPELYIQCPLVENVMMPEV